MSGIFLVVHKPGLMLFLSLEQVAAPVMYLLMERMVSGIPCLAQLSAAKALGSTLFTISSNINILRGVHVMR